MGQPYEKKGGLILGQISKISLKNNFLKKPVTGPGTNWNRLVIGTLVNRDPISDCPKPRTRVPRFWPKIEKPDRVNTPS
jgi:hypothetical protein